MPSTISLDIFLEDESSSPSAPEYSPVTVFETITSSSAESVLESGHDSSDSGSPVMVSTKSCSPMFERRASTQLTQSSEQSNMPTPWHGFKIVGDNIDKNIRPSFQRCDYQTKSFHYFNSYAVKDRIDLSDVSDIRPTHCINPEALIVSSGEWNRFKDDCCILIKR